jgi:hypothetical protein
MCLAVTFERNGESLGSGGSHRIPQSCRKLRVRLLARGLMMVRLARKEAIELRPPDTNPARPDPNRRQPTGVDPVTHRLRVHLQALRDLAHREWFFALGTA